MYIINSNFVLGKPIGDLSETRISELKKKFGNEFPEVLRQNEQTIIFKRGVTALVVSSEQIVYVTQDNAENLDIKGISNLLLQVNEVLGLSQKAKITVSLEGTEMFEKNILEASKGILSEASEILHAEGIGCRFVIRQEKFRGDIHIEPYLKDNQKIFYGIGFETEQVDLSEMEELFCSMFSYGTEKARDAARNIFSL
ncbi:TPA: hypothetical protein QCV53_001439 [Bacillus cereus]|nr:hypothetical protein [Bacillus cereus]